MKANKNQINKTRREKRDDTRSNTRSDTRYITRCRTQVHTDKHPPQSTQQATINKHKNNPNNPYNTNQKETTPEMNPTVSHGAKPSPPYTPINSTFQSPPDFSPKNKKQDAVSFSPPLSDSLKPKSTSVSFSLSKIKLNPDNPRLIKNERFERLKISLKEFPKMMELRPIIVGEDNVIIGGNMRYRALKAIGYKEVPREWVKFAHEMSKEEQERFVVVDNVSFGEDDWDVLANRWDKKELEQWGMIVPVWDEGDEKKEAVEDDYQMPEVVETDIVKGDLIEIGEHRLLCGDSTCGEDMEKLMAGNQMDMVFTDPPYGVDYKSKKLGKILNDRHQGDALFDFTHDAIFQLRQYCKKNIGYYVWYEDRHRIVIEEALKQAGLVVKSNLIWNKGMNLSGADYQKAHENCLYLAGKGERALWYGERDKKTILGLRRRDLSQMGKSQLLKMVLNMQDTSSVWDYDRDSVQEYAHPTQKPVVLSGRAINNSSLPYQNVADIFAGSGSTMVACHQLDRRCFSMELDPKFCQTIIDRMKRLDQDLCVKINGKEI